MDIRNRLIELNKSLRRAEFEYVKDLLKYLLHRRECFQCVHRIP